MNRNKIIILSLGLAAALLPGPIMYLKGTGKLSKGNDRRYDVDHTDELPQNALNGKRIIFLGSSVTYGSASGGESFVEYLAKRDGILPYKEALSGTTLVDEKVRGRDSYVTRMKTIDPQIKADCFICQLSTNDATMSKPLGKIATGYELETFDTKTVAGAIEYVISYARKTWNCPILFYTGTKYQSRKYEEMIDLLHKIASKWNIEVLDLWHDEQMNQVKKEEYRLYMANGVHPTKAGYRQWWTPKFEDKLKEMLRNE